MKKEERKEEEQVSIRDPEILAVADVLREELSQRGREKRHSFFKGIIQRVKKSFSCLLLSFFKKDALFF